VGGLTITRVRDATYLINVMVRAQSQERDRIETLRNLQIGTGTGDSIPLASIASFRYEIEQPVIWRRDRQPTITVSAGILDKTMPDTVVEQLKDKVGVFTEQLPVDYTVHIAGTVEESAKSQGPIA